VPLVTCTEVAPEVPPVNVKPHVFWGEVTPVTAPGGLATESPAGNVSVNATPVAELVRL